MATVAEKQHYIQTKDKNNKPTTKIKYKKTKTKINAKNDTNLEDLKAHYHTNLD